MATAIMRLTTGVVYVRSISGTISTSGITASGHLLFSPDNTYDIGASGATRPRDIYIGRSLGVGQAASGTTGVISIPTNGEFRFGAHSRIGNISDGVMMLYNNAGTGFTRLILGTNDASGIAIGKSSTTFQFVLGNDSGYAPVQASSIAAMNGGMTVTTNYSSALTTGTLVTNDAQSVLTATAIFLGANTIAGMFVVQDNASVNAIFSLNGSNNSTSEVADPLANFSVTKDTAGSINVYYDAAGASGAGYYLQNTRGSTRSIRMVRIGV